MRFGCEGLVVFWGVWVFFGAVFGWAFGCQRACGVCSRLLEMADFRFPLLAGGTEPLRGSPREAGGTYGGGNCELWRHSWYYPQTAPKTAEVASIPVRFAGNFESLCVDVEMTDARHRMAGTYGI